MLFTPKETLEEQILALLLEKEQSAKKIAGRIQDSGGSYSIQAIYGALRALLAAEVAIKNGASYSLNEEWRNKAVSRLEERHFKELHEGESIAYSLSNLVHYDLQWKNIVLPLHASYIHYPIFFYSRHYIWLHLGENRRQSELDYFKLFQTESTYAFSLIGSSSQFDTAIKNAFRNEYVEWALGIEYFPKTDYVTVLGDYVITTRIPKSLADEIDACYEAASNTKELEQRLQKIDIGKKRIRLIVERDAKKAKKLRKRMSRDFYVPRQLVEEFDLY